MALKDNRNMVRIQRDVEPDVGSITDTVWETLEVVSPQGVERSTLEAIASNVGVSLDDLLSDGDDLLPNLADVGRDSDGQPSVPAGSQSMTYSSVEARDGDKVDGSVALEQNLAEAGDLTKLALLSTAPHTNPKGATSLGETLRTTLHNLAANRTRGLLTMLGIIIGVFCVVVLQAIGNGLMGYVDDLTGDYGGNNVTIQPARLIVNGLDAGTLQRTLSLADAQALADPGAVPDAVAVSPVTSSRTLVHAGDANFATTVVGVWPDYLTVGGYTLKHGAFVTAEDVANRALVVVLGANPASKLFGDTDPTGQTVWINDAALRVEGVLAARESLLAGGDDNSYLPLSTALDRVIGGQQSYADGSKALDSIVLRASSSTTIGAVQDEATSVLAARHRTPGGAPDFVASSLLSALEQRRQILAAMNAFMAVVAGISLLVGGIGIMNIMLVSVAERTHEIGLRKAVGARSRDILNQFLMEAMLISLVGAGIGVGFAALVVATVSVLWRPCPPSVPGVIIAVLAALATGLFFGVSPAKRAAALQPIQALRAE